MVTLLPYKALEIETDLSIQEISSILGESTVRFRWIQPVTSPKPFIGNVTNTGFMIYRTINFRNSWQPVAYGSYRALNGKTQVRVIISWAISVMILTPILFAGAVFASYILSGIFGFRLIMGMVAFCFLLYVFALGYYTTEAKLLAEFLEQTLAKTKHE